MPPKTDTADTAATTSTVSVLNASTRMVDLDVPIVRGEQRFEQLAIRKPTSGALRGVSLIALVNLDVAALQAIIPRVCEPILTPQEVANLDPADLLAVGATLGSFFVQKKGLNDLGFLGA
ncbi:phage tail assembly protein [Orrella dioscoreae]|uniref:GpE n=2 Tax=root TaxID=1 RepID=A0A1C3K3M1_9BURK|nr:phage tail assembly protein [Orrella dioscoreae]SBT25967.1 GpE [Orrella dioscoreae]SOE50877.1 GpE [Orrella dioscoreae]